MPKRSTESSTAQHNYHYKSCNEGLIPQIWRCCWIWFDLQCCKRTYSIKRIVYAWSLRKHQPLQKNRHFRSSRHQQSIHLCLLLHLQKVLWINGISSSSDHHRLIEMHASRTQKTTARRHLSRSSPLWHVSYPQKIQTLQLLKLHLLLHPKDDACQR